jgi:hypothetical protein
MGAVTEPDLAAVAEQLRLVLAAVVDPHDELTAGAATRHRIEGAALVLDVLAAQPSPGTSSPITR